VSLEWISWYLFNGFALTENSVVELSPPCQNVSRSALGGGERTGQTSLTTGYGCFCNAKEIKILFCKQIGQSPNTSYTKCRMGLRERKMEIAGNGFGSRHIFVS
jgi:hypothetical protein